MNDALSRAARRAGLLVAGLNAVLASATAYGLALLTAAFAGRRQPPPTAPDPLPRFMVLIPAHDEEGAIGETLRAAAGMDYPADRLEVVVIADNCSDRTAEIAERHGARALVRSDPQRRGKGRALAWALERLDGELARVDAILFLDADCHPTPTLARALAACLAEGANAAQANYVVANPDESWVSALRYAAFALINEVRARGRWRLGLSGGLFGTGFALRRELLERHPWTNFTLSEDHEYHLRLVAAGERVAFAADAAVLSLMPTSLSGAREQAERWEGGKLDLVRVHAPHLLRAGLSARRPSLVLTALDEFAPPQSLMLAANVVLLPLAFALPSRAARRLAVFNAVGQSVYVLGGLRVAGAPASVYRALVRAPLLAAWKLRIYARLAAGRGPEGWVRTQRPTE